MAGDGKSFSAVPQNRIALQFCWWLVHCGLFPQNRVRSVTVMHSGLSPLNAGTH